MGSTILLTHEEFEEVAGEIIFSVTVQTALVDLDSLPNCVTLPFWKGKVDPPSKMSPITHMLKLCSHSSVLVLISNYTGIGSEPKC